MSSLEKTRKGGNTESNLPARCSHGLCIIQYTIESWHYPLSAPIPPEEARPHLVTFSAVGLAEYLDIHASRDSELKTDLESLLEPRSLRLREVEAAGAMWPATKKSRKCVVKALKVLEVFPGAGHGSEELPDMDELLRPPCRYKLTTPTCISERTPLTGVFPAATVVSYDKYNVHGPHKPAPFELLTSVMQLRAATFIALVLATIFSTTAAAAPPQDTEFSVENDYCGVWHDGVFHQYRRCCDGFNCTPSEHLTRTVTDVVRSLSISDRTMWLTLKSQRCT
ncbi:hypothetical protein B0H14DRAFT_2568740 [Mycena olivaceomarginata]|nr:hypothetical protein B0H14DRAFT_2568740 [Mycena olivaceomarginata]